MQSYIMTGLPTHLVQELNVSTVAMAYATLPEGQSPSRDSDQKRNQPPDPGPSQDLSNLSFGQVVS